MSQQRSSANSYTIYGMMSSYFTKKLEAYFLIKGIPYQFVEVNMSSLAQFSRAVGIAQIPTVQCPDGSWLTDSSLIIQHFEADDSYPSLTPNDPISEFFSYFLEDCFDEWLWASALYFRWAFQMDRERRREEFSHTLLSNAVVNAPKFMRKAFMSWRQKTVHLKDNGIVSVAHARYIEDQYLELLQLLQQHFKQHPFLFGNRPTVADIGLFGPMFPHFACDPTPQEIMHVSAPHVFRWVGRLWSTRPEELETQSPTEIPQTLVPLIKLMAAEYLPYLVENQKAFLKQELDTSYHLGGLQWTVRTAPYRVFCLAQLQERFQKLNIDEQAQCHLVIGDEASRILTQPLQCPDSFRKIRANKPIAGVPKDGEVTSRLWFEKRRAIDRFWDFMAPKSKPATASPEMKDAENGWLPIYFEKYRAASK